MNVLLYTVLFLLIGGAGAGWLITLTGVSWMPEILLMLMAIMVAGVLLARIGSVAFIEWWRAEGLFITGYISGLLSAMATWFWFETNKPAMGWAALILFIIAILCFIRYTCRWNNWCNHFNNWWTATGWPAIRVASARVFTWFRGPFLRGVGWALRRIGDLLGLGLQHVRLLLLLATGAGLYYTAFHGPLWMSVWYWAMAFAIALLLYSPWCRRFVRIQIRRFGRFIWRLHVANWRRLSGGAQFMLAMGGIIWIYLVTYLLIKGLQNQLVLGHMITLPSVGIVLGAGVVGWLLCSVMAGHGPRPQTPAQRRARHAAGAHP